MLLLDQLDPKDPLDQLDRQDLKVTPVQKESKVFKGILDQKEIRAQREKLDPRAIQEL
jgi:hypothetical protein